MKTLWLAAALVVGCSAKSPGPATPMSPITGAVSEAEFKAMHAPPTQGKVTLHGQTIDLAGTKAYLALPPGPGPFPAIVVIHEWWGLNDNIEHWADRLASAGWAAVAVDLYGGVVATTPDAALAAVKAVDEAKAAATISAAIDFVAKDPRIHATKRAVIGWCFGGGWSFKTAVAHPELDGAIMYYGSFETDPAKLAPIKARLLAIFGDKDKSFPADQVAAFDAALKQAGVKAEIRHYDADHAFANPSNPHYDEASAGDAWTHVLALLDDLKKR